GRLNELKDLLENIFSGVYYCVSGINSSDTEFTQCLVFLSVNLSPKKTCPKCPPQLLQIISVRLPSASGNFVTAPSISSSKLGQPQFDSNLSEDLYKGVLQRLQAYVPFSLWSLNLPVKGRSVPL